MSDDLTADVLALIQNSPTAPFLFIGSGFSRRYLGLEDWKGLINRFCQNLNNKPYQRYLSESNGNIPASISAMSEDYSEYWWNVSGNEKIASKEGWVSHMTSPLRHDICEYLNQVSLDEALNHPEVQCLKDEKTVIDGIITTNWDLLLEQIFPDSKVFVGQKGVLFNNQQSIAEIYKIHGCASDSNSLVLTDEDYQSFNNKSAYLSAKLLSIFLEHPVFFIVYSANDENIKSILKQLSEMMNTEDLDARLGKNLIFLERSKGAGDSVQHTYQNFENGVRIPITRVKTDDFSKVYKAFQVRKRLIPAHLLRMFKEQLYSIVQSEDPTTKMFVAKMEEIVKNDSDVQFVAGIGVADDFRSNFGKIGLNGLSAEAIFRDVVFDDLMCGDEVVLREVIPNITKHQDYLPIRKYLKVDANWRPTHMTPRQKRVFNLSLKDLTKKIPETYRNIYLRNKFSSRKVAEILSSEFLRESHKINCMALRLSEKSTDDDCIALVKEFLEENFDRLLVLEKNTDFKRLICIYDFILS